MVVVELQVEVEETLESGRVTSDTGSVVPSSTPVFFNGCRHCIVRPLS